MCSPRYTVWSQVSGSWEDVALLLSATPHLPAFEDVGLGLFLPIAQKVGWEAVEVRPTSPHCKRAGGGIV